VGVGGVVATLVGCGDDADAGWSTTTALPDRGGGGGGKAIWVADAASEAATR